MLPYKKTPKEKQNSMKIKVLAILSLLGMSLFSNAQTQFTVADKFHSGLSDSLTNQIVMSFDELLLGIDNGRLDTSLIDMEHKDLNRYFFSYLRGVERKDTIPKYFRGQLINLYPVGNDQYLFTLLYSKSDEIGRIVTFLAKRIGGKIVFSTSLKYHTRHWKRERIGTITYYYQDTIDRKRAESFDQKNIAIAQKLNLPVMDWDMYICGNFQEVLRLQGYDYDYRENGKYNSGYIMDPKTLFSCMNDEDFSHDVLHLYASEIRGKARNAVGECGLAYYWGNAYHPSGNGEKAPELEELVYALQKYLPSHPDMTLSELFDKNPDVLAEYGFPHPIQVNKVIAGVICREIERQKGNEGIIELIKCGRGNDNFLKAVDSLIGINKENFDDEVYKLVFGK